MPSRALVAVGGAGLALGACRLASEAFVTAPAAAPALPQQTSLRGSSSASAAGAVGSSAPTALIGVAGLAVAAASARGRAARRAEPVSAAAAAAAAAKAAGAAGAAGTAKAAASAGAVKTASAVAGSAGTGSLAKGASDGSQKPQGGGSPQFDPAKQVGVTEPLGYFDPAGFCTSEESFRSLRAAEIKHARVAMMAALGAVVQHYVKLPGFEKVPSGLGAVVEPPGSYGFVALFAVAGALELGVWTESPDKEPGNFGDPAGLGQYTEDMRNRELNNGRAAMFAAIGIISAELLTGKDGVQQLGL